MITFNGQPVNFCRAASDETVTSPCRGPVESSKYGDVCDNHFAVYCGRAMAAQQDEDD